MVRNQTKDLKSKFLPNHLWYVIQNIDNPQALKFVLEQEPEDPLGYIEKLFSIVKSEVFSSGFVTPDTIAATVDSPESLVRCANILFDATNLTKHRKAKNATQEKLVGIIRDSPFMPESTNFTDLLIAGFHPKLAFRLADGSQTAIFAIPDIRNIRLGFLNLITYTNEPYERLKNDFIGKLMVANSEFKLVSLSDPNSNRCDQLLKEMAFLANRPALPKHFLLDVYAQFARDDYVTRPVQKYIANTLLFKDIGEDAIEQFGSSLCYFGHGPSLTDLSARVQQSGDIFELYDLVCMLPDVTLQDGLLTNQLYGIIEGVKQQMLQNAGSQLDFKLADKISAELFRKGYRSLTDRFNVAYKLEYIDAFLAATQINLGGEHSAREYERILTEAIPNKIKAKEFLGQKIFEHIGRFVAQIDEWQDVKRLLDNLSAFYDIDLGQNSKEFEKLGYIWANANSGEYFERRIGRVRHDVQGGVVTREHK